MIRIHPKTIVFALTLSLALIPVKSAIARRENDSVKPTNSESVRRKNKVRNNDFNQDSLKLKTTLVNLHVAVLDPDGRFVWGLGKSDFDVYLDGVRQRIEMFSEEDTPVSIGIVFDVSGSMKYNIRRSQEVLQRFVDASNKTDEFFLVGFRSRPEILRDFTTDGSSIAEAASSLQTKGNTALYDAIYLALEKVKEGKYTRRAIVIISDGEENHSRYRFKDLTKLIKESDVQIYAIGVQETDTGEFGSTTLKEIVNYTGGHAFFPGNKEDMENDITRIALELRHQYLISFVPHDAGNDGRWHDIKVKISQSDNISRLVARARSGYFAQSQADRHY
jgi:Ca-activated chloride channel family protein